MLCLVTDRLRLAGRLGCDPSQALARLPELIAAAAAARIDMVQIRERDLEAADLVRLVRASLDAVAGSSTRVVVNDRLDVALAAGAGGVHLRSDSLPIERAKQLAPPGFLIGRSVHSADEAAAAGVAGASYLIFGTVFPSRSKPEDAPLAGVEQLAEAVRRSNGTPVLAIGGMTTSRAAAVAATGAAGLAGIDLFLPSSEGYDLTSVAGTVRNAFLQAARAREKRATPG